MGRGRGEHAELVRSARKEVGITQAELARRIGVTVGAIGALETGIRVLGPEKTALVAEALGMDARAREELFRTRQVRAAELSGERVHSRPVLREVPKEVEDFIADVLQRVTSLEERVRALEESRDIVAEGPAWEPEDLVAGFSQGDGDVGEPPADGEAESG